MTPPFRTADIDDIYRAGGFDPATLRSIAQSLVDDRMRRLFEITRVEFAEAMTRLRAAIAAKDFGRALNEAHALRGAAANIGAVTLADAVSRYEAGLQGETFSPILLGAIDAAVAMADSALAKLDPGP